MDVQQVFTSYDSLNQAIQPEVVGPLFKKGGSLSAFRDCLRLLGDPSGYAPRRVSAWAMGLTDMVSFRLF